MTKDLLYKTESTLSEEEALQSPFAAWTYAHEVLKDRFLEGESIIAEDPFTAYLYAKNILNFRFPAGEPTILQDPLATYRYVDEVIKERWRDGEDAISKYPWVAYLYARDILHNRFPQAEKAISETKEVASMYINDVLVDIFEDKSISDLIDIVEDPDNELVKEAAIIALQTFGSKKESEYITDEEKALQSPLKAFWYAWSTLERFPAGESIIAQSPKYSYLYADTILTDRFPLGEPTIAKDPSYSPYYKNIILKPLFEDKSISELIDILEDDPIDMVKEVALEVLQND